MPFKIKERFYGKFNTSSVLWLHGASLGECQVLLFLAKRLAREIKNCPPILLTSQKAEVVDFLKIKLEGVSKIQVHIAPAPFYFIVKRFYRQVKPLALILCENELWPAYLALEQERKSDARLALISGRFKRGNFLPKKIFKPEIFAFADFQTNEDKERFLKKCNHPFATVNGNWKLLGKKTFLENHDKKIDASFLSLHFKELPFLKDLFKNLSKENKSFLVAPRRISDVKKFNSFFESLKIECVIFPKVKPGCVSLVESFGKFKEFLPLSNCAVVGGSFVRYPGIHDFREPLLYGVPTYIGPFTYGQEESVLPYLNAKILQKLPSEPKSLPPFLVTPEEIVKFLEQELEAVEQSYSSLRNKLSTWVLEK